MKRVIGGKEYFLTTTHKTKSEANKHAKSLRKEGFRCRVVKLSDVYGVYFTASKRKTRR